MENMNKRKEILINRNDNIFPDHTLWIKEQLSKKKFIYTRGREVLIKAPGRNLKKIVNIPPQNDPNYKSSWISVYNLCLDYLEGTINAACIENKFIQRMGNSWTLNGHIISWPKFNSKNADYAKELEKILDEYTYVKNKYIQKHKPKENISVKRTKVPLIPANEIISKPEISPKKNHIIQKKSHIEKTLNVQEQTLKKYKIQKISDGDKINHADIEKLRSMNTDLVFLTCQDILNTKEEDLFIRNNIICSDHRLKTGIFIYSKMTNEHEAATELKRLVKMIKTAGDNFSHIIIYSVNNEYVKSIKNSDIKLLEFINIYNTVISTLKKAGFIAMISMNLETRIVIDDINRRYNMNHKHDIIYMILVRDVEMVDSNDSIIVIDPWNDFDTVHIKNKGLLETIKNNIKINDLAEKA